LLERILQHFIPTSGIKKSNSHGMLDEGRDASRPSGCDESANFFNLIVRKSDGDLCRCHTKDHTIGTVRFESGLRLNSLPLSGAAQLKRSPEDAIRPPMAQVDSVYSRICWESRTPLVACGF
jgi:hypothetical protein